MSYAADTSVSVSKTRGHIEDLVQRAGGRRFMSMSEPDRAVVLFELAERRVMFELPVPALETFANKPTRRTWGHPLKRSAEEQRRAWEQACRSRWRALFLAIKAKLVSVESGVESMEEAFLAQIVVPTDDGTKRFAEVATAAIRQAYTGGSLPPLLGAGR